MLQALRPAATTGFALAGAAALTSALLASPGQQSPAPDAVNVAVTLAADTVGPVPDEFGSAFIPQEQDQIGLALSGFFDSVLEWLGLGDLPVGWWFSGPLGSILEWLGLTGPVHILEAPVDLTLPDIGGALTSTADLISPLPVDLDLALGF